jgi:hypothetical protein
VTHLRGVGGVGTAALAALLGGRHACAGHHLPSCTGDCTVERLGWCVNVPYGCGAVVYTGSGAGPETGAPRTVNLHFGAAKAGGLVAGQAQRERARRACVIIMSVGQCRLAAAAAARQACQSSGAAFPRLLRPILDSCRDSGSCDCIPGLHAQHHAASAALARGWRRWPRLEGVAAAPGRRAAQRWRAASSAHRSA